MRPRFLRETRYRVAIGAVAALGALALVQHWLADRRPVALQLRAAQEFVVTSSGDDGPGSLREAIFAADSVQGRARIVLRPDVIVLRTPLPPLVNPSGIVVEVADAKTEIDARALAAGPIFDVDAPNSVISGVKMLHAPEQAVLLRADAFRLVGATIVDCDEGLHVADNVDNLIVESTRFENNRLGVQLESTSSGIILRGNRFVGHRDAAVWAVRGKPLDDADVRGATLSGNYFEDDRMSLVLGNVRATVENNEFVKAREVALFLIGGGAIVRGNRIRSGSGIGIFADATQGTLIEANELDHNRALAILVRSSRGALLRKNRVYDNGYGIGFVLNERSNPNVAADNTLLTQQFDGIVVIGDSPVIRRNVALNNRSAGLRILTFLPRTGPRIAANPFIDNNTFGGNTLNEPVRGEFRAAVVETAR